MPCRPFLLPLPLGLLVMTGCHALEEIEPYQEPRDDMSFFDDMRSFGESRVVEAEDMILGQGTRRVFSNVASGQMWVEITGNQSTMEYTFPGPGGTYDIEVTYFDESDGEARMAVQIQGMEVDTWVWDQDLGSIYANASTRTSRLIAEVALKGGDSIRLIGTPDAEEPARTDVVTIRPRPRRAP